MPREPFDEIRDAFDSGDTYPYATREARDALSDEWISAIDRGIGDEETAVYLSAFDIENPGDIDWVHVEYADSEWSIEFSDGTIIEIGAEMPDWVWDELYDLADEADWDWEVKYAED